jgi:hypothetical protein
MKQPWTDYDARAGQTGWDNHWDAPNWPFVVRWSVSFPDRLTRWISHTRSFQTLAEALAAYKRPFAGIDVDLVKYNGGKPGQHLTTLARRKAGKPTKWHDKIPNELR